MAMYAAFQVLDAIAQALGCETKDVENELERRFEVKIHREHLHESYQSAGRLDAIRRVSIFNPGEGNDIVDHILKLVGK